MKKAIKVTQEILDNNRKLLKNKKVGDIIIYTEDNFPKVWNNSTVNFNSNLPEFKNVITPELMENEELGELIENGGVFIYDIKQKVLPTLEELREQKLTEANQVFDEYRRILTEASIEALVMNEVTPELRQLTNTLRQVKKRILADLQTLDFEGLQKFTFQTEEAEQLRMAIESFKV